MGTIRVLTSAVLLVGVAAGAAADDAPLGRTTPTKSELLKDCIRKHEADDVSLSKSELHRLCKAEVKQQKSASDAPPPQDAPRP